MMILGIKQEKKNDTKTHFALYLIHRLDTTKLL